MERLVFTNANGTVCCDAPLDAPERLCPACHAAFVRERHAAMLAARRFASHDNPAPAPTFESMLPALREKGMVR
jgi:hypothetical protein